MRASGVLLPVSSLPSKYGIGSFSESAYEFVDQLKKAGQSYWQILPIGPTGYGDSPYQSVSTFAGNPYFIDLEQLINEGLLTSNECEEVDFTSNLRYIDYAKLYNSRHTILRLAYSRSDCSTDREYNAFIIENAYWLEDYALFMAIKDSYGGSSWVEWDSDIKFRNGHAIYEYRTRFHEDVEFYKYIQYLFFKQWGKLKKYANDNDIKIIGDIPIYVAFDSADAWSRPELFQFDESLEPLAISGCPPDDFTEDGQLWGNPLYRWDVHKESGYEWWISRIKFCFEIFDTVRIDHFKGFDEYYSIPAGREDARIGAWEHGPGYDIFHAIEHNLGKKDIIAEDLGYITDSVRALLKKTGFPGMKILEFAFDSNSIGEGDYLPHNFNNNCVVYTGTHDNQTVKDWINHVSEDDLEYILDYCDKTKDDLDNINWHMIRLAQSSVANLCIIPIQDYLGLGAEARINEPGTIGTNWTWRLLEGEITEEIIKKMKNMAKLYGRI